MNCKAHFYLLNDHFSVEHANENFNGEESELNRKHQWEDELEIKTEVSDVHVEENGIYVLQGSLPDGGSFNHDVKKMKLFNIANGEQVVAQLACSESILSSFDVEKNDDGLIVKIYIKDDEPLANPVPGVYIAVQEFPKELIF
ncbi:MAG: hypothetical protein HRT57_09765 [Crocinitomicaceae bacterium]|nr:hypothetical protein [Crocinitomicaceae bacterium]